MLLFGDLLSSVFFIFYMYGKFWMSSFQRFWPRLIWSYGYWDIALGRKVMQCWKILWCFSLKIHIFQSEADMVEPSWWKLARTLFFKMVQPTHSGSCPISTVYCAKYGKKLLVFPLKKVKVFIRVFSILVISHPF